MKACLLLRCVLLAVASAAPAVLSSAADAPDRAAELLRLTGRLAVRAAGPYVEIGTYRIQVASKLGSPTARLADGTWLYDHFAAENSAAHGTLVVRFAGGRVHELYLAAPAAIAALRETANPPHLLVAAKR
ncbi:MAG TPA: hypothetical protein VHE13_00560 [Opitutus sp.]|nr:hypothetical protein [Opitutus sp.]